MASLSTNCTRSFPHIAWETVGSAFAAPQRMPKDAAIPPSSAAQQQSYSDVYYHQFVTMNEYARRLIKNTRRAHRYSQKSLAAKLYIVPEDLKALENGTHPVSKHIVDIVMFALDIKLIHNGPMIQQQRLF